MDIKQPIFTVNTFVDEGMRFGSPLGIIVDEGHEIDAKHRQQIATKLNYSETVFIDDRNTGAINVFSPIRECPFSMYAALGSAWFIRTVLHTKIDKLISKDQSIETFIKDENTWVRSKTTILPSWNFVQYGSAQEIESLHMSDFTQAEHVMVWSWMDEEKGIIRARTFAADWGIPEDEANGSGTMRLAARLGKQITVIHGKGSVLHANHYNQDFAEVGGQCHISS